jgi:hypothetical protein
MSTLTCNQVLEEIELYAAGECDPAQREAIEQHIAGCTSCAGALEEAREVVGWVTLSMREPAALERLRDSVAKEARRPRQSRHLLVLKVAAMAAVLLLTVGLFFWMSPDRDQPRPILAAAEIGPAPGAVYSVATANQIDVQRGEVLVRVAPDSPQAAAFEVRTPAGTATAERGEFIVGVAPGGPVSIKVLSGEVSLRNEHGKTQGRRGESMTAAGDAAPKRQLEDPVLRFARSYTPVKVKATGRVPSHGLPVDLAKVANWSALSKDLETAEKSLREQGFAVVADAGGEDLVSPYRRLAEKGLPVMVTSDSILYLVRQQLGNVLRDLEENELALDLTRLTKALREKVAEAKPPAVNRAEWLQAQQFATFGLAVGERLLHPQTEMPGVEEKATETLVQNIEAGQARKDFLFGDIYAKFRPIGHYTAGATLPRYYRAMTWFSLMPLVRDDDDEKMRVRTIAAAMVAEALPQTTLADGRNAADVWRRIYAITGFFAGVSEDPGPLQYAQALEKANILADPSVFARFRRELAQYLPPPFFGNVAQAPVRPRVPENLTLPPGTGFRFMGQRFAIDAYALSKLAYPTVGPAVRPAAFTTETLASGEKIRGLPRGLDLMALQGSALARRLLHESGDDAYVGSTTALGYDAAFDQLRNDLARLDVVDWNRDLYWSWLYTLQPLLRGPAPGLPTYMTAPDYQTAKLSTALASWTQLRSDTVLYVRRFDPDAEALKNDRIKMDFAKELVPPRGSPAPIFLEPQSELYGRLLALTRMTARALTALNALGDDAKERLGKLEHLLESAVTVAEKELDNAALGGEERDWVQHLPEHLGNLTASRAEPPLVVTLMRGSSGRRVLQEAIGRPDLALFVVRQTDGSLVLAMGPVLSYYEWTSPAGQEVTQEMWLEHLNSPRGPARLPWTPAR